MYFGRLETASNGHKCKENITKYDTNLHEELAGTSKECLESLVVRLMATVGDERSHSPELLHHQ